MAKRIYVTIDNLEPLIDWLKTKPEGECMVLIAGSEDALPNLMAAATGQGRGFAQWVLTKMQSGQLVIKSISQPVDDLPIGVVLEG